MFPGVLETRYFTEAILPWNGLQLWKAGVLSKNLQAPCGGGSHAGARGRYPLSSLRGTAFTLCLLAKWAASGVTTVEPFSYPLATTPASPAPHFRISFFWVRFSVSCQVTFCMTKGSNPVPTPLRSVATRFSGRQTAHVRL